MHTQFHDHTARILSANPLHHHDMQVTPLIRRRHAIQPWDSTYKGLKNEGQIMVSRCADGMSAHQFRAKWCQFFFEIPVCCFSVAAPKNASNSRKRFSISWPCFRLPKTETPDRIPQCQLNFVQDRNTGIFWKDERTCMLCTHAIPQPHQPQPERYES
jgi:hypothetical protein